MADGLDRQETAKQLAEWSWRDDPDHELLKAVAANGHEGIELLMDEHSRRKDQYEREWFVEAMAHSGNLEAVEALRQIAHTTGTGSTASRGIANYGLASMLGSDATDDLESALDDRDRGIRQMAMMKLAEVGTSSAWDRAFKELRRVLSRRSKSIPSPPEVTTYVCYLGRFADMPERRVA